AETRPRAGQPTVRPESEAPQVAVRQGRVRGDDDHYRTVGIILRLRVIFGQTQPRKIEIPSEVALHEHSDRVALPGAADDPGARADATLVPERDRPGARTDSPFGHRSRRGFFKRPLHVFAGDAGPPDVVQLAVVRFTDERVDAR